MTTPRSARGKEPAKLPPASTYAAPAVSFYAPGLIDLTDDEIGSLFREFTGEKDAAFHAEADQQLTKPTETINIFTQYKCGGVKPFCKKTDAPDYVHNHDDCNENPAAPRPTLHTRSGTGHGGTENPMILNNANKKRTVASSSSGQATPSAADDNESENASPAATRKKRRDR